jgi:hypothetical protein
MSNKQFIDQTEIARWQYRKRKRLKWMRKLPWIPAIIGVISAALGILSFIPAQVGLWLTLGAALFTLGGQFIPSDESSQEQRSLENILDQHIERSKRK